MTLDKQKLIDAMAKPIHEGHSCMIWEEARMLAKAAFAALQDNMPEITLNLHEDITLNEEKAKLWDKLKNLGR